MFKKINRTMKMYVMKASYTPLSLQNIWSLSYFNSQVFHWEISPVNLVFQMFHNLMWIYKNNTWRCKSNNLNNSDHNLTRVDPKVSLRAMIVNLLLKQSTFSRWFEVRRVQVPEKSWSCKQGTMLNPVAEPLHDSPGENCSSRQSLNWG